LSQKLAGIPKIRSSCRAESGVIEAFPLMISLIVFKGRPIRLAKCTLGTLRL